MEQCRVLDVIDAGSDFIQGLDGRPLSVGVIIIRSVVRDVPEDHPIYCRIQHKPMFLQNLKKFLLGE